MIAKEYVPETAPERMEQAHFDPRSLHVPPELPLGAPRTVGVRENPDFHTSVGGDAKHSEKLPPGFVIFEDIGFQKDLIFRAFDVLDYRSQSLLSAKEELNPVAVVDGIRLNATDQFFKTIVANSPWQGLGQTAHLFSSQLFRQFSARTRTESCVDQSALFAQPLEPAPAEGVLSLWSQQELLPANVAAKIELPPLMFSG